MYNRVILIGRLAADPELAYTPNGKAVCKMRLAVDGPYSNAEGKRDAVFVNLTVWNKMGETCANRLGKGRMIAVEGKLNIRSYEAKDGSGKRSSTEIICDNVRFLDWPKDEQGGAPAARSNNAGKSDFGGDMMDFSDFGTEVDFSKDDIPF